MNQAHPAVIDNLPEFLLHAITLERESVDRYEELAESMAVHNNPGMAELFHKLAHFGRLHASEIEQHAAALVLPDIAPWNFKWSTPEGPESGTRDGVHYLMDQREALEHALYNETQGRDFYASVASSSPDEEVRELAAQFSREESEHVAILESWLTRLAPQNTRRLEDLDPPNSPD